MSTPAPRRGRPVTDAERRWLEQADRDLSAAASLARIETTARLAFAAVVGATGLLTTLGLTTSARMHLLEDPAVLGLSWPVALLLVSLLLSGCAIVPSLRVIELSSPSAVADFYRAAILRRGALVLAALLLLATGLTAAVAAVVEPTHTAPQLTTTASTNGAVLQVSATASAMNLRGRPLGLVVRRGTNGQVLCRTARSRAEDDATVTCGPLSVRASRVTVIADAGGRRTTTRLERGK